LHPLSVYFFSFEWAKDNRSIARIPGLPSGPEAGNMEHNLVSLVT